MRRVAQELNVGTMSLYYYVKTKDDLVGAMDDALMQEAVLPSLPKGWQRAMMAIARRTYAVFVRHPWALVAMLSAPPGINAMRHMEQCLEALAETSMTNKQKITLLATIDDFVFGHALRETAIGAAIDIDFASAQLATGCFPRLAEVFRGGRIEANKARFDQGILALLTQHEAE
jgi:AcrR family transcriptional regulator